jgi:hypothetical protein
LGARQKKINEEAELYKRVHEDSDLSGIARRAKPECVFDKPREQKTQFPKKSIEKFFDLWSIFPVCIGIKENFRKSFNEHIHLCES